MKYIIKCPICGQMYKTNLVIKNGENHYLTDYNDDVTNKCIKCNHTMDSIIMKTEDWIADMIFTIKGK